MKKRRKSSSAFLAAAVLSSVICVPSALAEEAPAGGDPEGTLGISALEAGSALGNGLVEVQTPSKSIDLVRGVEKSVRFYYTDEEGRVKSAGLVRGGRQLDEVFNPIVKTKLGQDGFGKFVDISFLLNDSFSADGFPYEGSPEKEATWTRYLALYGGEDGTGDILNSVGSQTDSSMFSITVRTQAGGFLPSLPARVVVDDASDLSGDEIDAVRRALEAERGSSGWGGCAKDIEVGERSVSVTYKDGTADVVDIRELVNEAPKFRGDDELIFLMPDVPVDGAKVKEKIEVTDDRGILSVERGHERNAQDDGYKTDRQDPLGGTSIVVEGGAGGKTAHVYYGIESGIDQGEVEWVLGQADDVKIHRSFLATDVDGAETDSESVEIVLYRPEAGDMSIGAQDSLTVREQDILSQVDLGFIHYSGTEHEDKISKRIRSVEKDGVAVAPGADGYALKRDPLASATYAVTVAVESDWGQAKDIMFDIVVAQQELDVTKMQASAAVEAAAAGKISDIENSGMTLEEKAAAIAEVGKDKADALTSIGEAADANAVLAAQAVGENAIGIDKSKLRTEYGRKDAVKAGVGYTEADEAKKRAYDEALAEAKAVLANAGATQAEIDESLSKLKAAKELLGSPVGGPRGAGSDHAGQPRPLGIPKTGDSGAPALSALLAVLSASSLGGLMAIGRSRKER